MTKIPVGETIANSYAFAFKHAPTNFAVAWITLLLPAIGGQIVEHFFPPHFPMPGGNPAAGLQTAFAGPPMLLFYVAFLCIFAQMALFTREALGLRTGPAFRQNPIGADTWRVVLAMLLLFVAFVAIYVVVLVIALFGVVIVATVAKLSPDVSSFVQFLTVFGGLALIVGLPVGSTYLVLRLGFLAVPVVVAEKHVSLTRSWELARGNVGRIFLVWLSAALPFLVLEFLFVWWATGGHPFPPIHAGMKADELAAWQRQYLSTMQNQMRGMWTYWYLTVPLGVAFSTIAYGLFSALPAFAYRALTSPPKPPQTEAIVEA